VLIAGGSTNLLTANGGPGTPVSSAEIFNPTGQTFTATVSPMSIFRAAATATLLPNGEVLIAGGSLAAGGNAGNSADLYNPNTGEFAPTGTMSVAREFAAAVLLPSGKVLVTGGTNNSAAPATSSAEFYNPGTGGFTATTNSMTAPRVFQTATVLPNGNVLIAGGAASPDPLTGLPNNVILSTAELYAPAAGTFTATGNMMTTGRAIMTATLLPNGLVLVAGGSNSVHGPLSTTDLFGVVPIGGGGGGSP
jgi:hypothetical protein